jgi:hypothetical protein
VFFMLLDSIIVDSEMVCIAHPTWLSTILISI